MISLASSTNIEVLKILTSGDRPLAQINQDLRSNDFEMIELILWFLANVATPDKEILKLVVNQTIAIECFDKFTYLLSSGNVQLSSNVQRTLSFLAYKLTMQIKESVMKFDTLKGLKVEKNEVLILKLEHR
jgi:hypothetical protein